MSYIPYQPDNEVEAKIEALRTALIMLAACVADRLPDGELQSRLEYCAQEAEMQGAEFYHIETANLLRAMANNAHPMRRISDGD